MIHCIISVSYTNLDVYKRQSPINRDDKNNRAANDVLGNLFRWFEVKISRLNQERINIHHRIYDDLKPYRIRFQQGD